MRVRRGTARQLALGASGSFGSPVTVAAAGGEAQTDADTTEKTLFTYDLPANTLDVNAKLLRITVNAFFAANANVKTLRLYFGATVAGIVSGAANNASLESQTLVFRTGPATQIRHHWAYFASSGVVQGVANGIENTALPINIKVTGQNGTASAGDILLKQVVVEVLG